MQPSRNEEPCAADARRPAAYVDPVPAHLLDDLVGGGGDLPRGLAVPKAQLGGEAEGVERGVDKRDFHVLVDLGVPVKLDENTSQSVYVPVNGFGKINEHIYEYSS